MLDFAHRLLQMMNEIENLNRQFAAEFTFPVRHWRVGG